MTTTIQSLAVGDFVLPRFPGTVTSKEGGSEIQGISGKGEEKYLILIAEDGKLHEFEAALFRKRLEHEV
jgi:hypothetical protein